MGKHIIMVGVGGMAGSIARFLASTYITKYFLSLFPFGTFIVNVTGCLLIGLLYGLSSRYQWFDSDWRLFLATGFCGGYTTFSSFSAENMQLIQQSMYGTFALYSIASFSLGLLAVFIGFQAIRLI